MRAIDDILKDTFGIEDGLADHKRVTVLDFACGTGTFLVEVLEKIFETIGPDSGKRDLIIKEHILKNIFGFEFLIAPYTIAHLKLSQYLNERQYKLQENERLQIYLTNTVEPIQPQKNLYLPELTYETEAAQSVKDKPILVITGNPPYSGLSKNKGKWITGLIETYRKDFPELSKPGQGKWLQDDYVKFIRFAQWKMESVEEGIVGVITNHSFLDNPTFKGMRKSLAETFDQIYILDLHGNSKKKERAEDGTVDENVFDIEQGVAISIFVKRPGIDRKILRSDEKGSRNQKYIKCASIDFKSQPWKDIPLDKNSYLFDYQNSKLKALYESFFKTEEIFSLNGDPAPGVVSTHDDFAISNSEKELKQKISKFLNTGSEKDARSIFVLCRQNQWNYDRAKNELADVKIDDLSTKLIYRPFDIRHTLYNRNVTVHLRKRLTQHFFRKKNIGLCIGGQMASTGSEQFDIVSVCDEIIDYNLFRRGGAFVFPLWLYRDDEFKDLFSNSQNRENKVENINGDVRAFIDQRYAHHFSPEEIFGYLYAVLHAPTYRRVFAEFLRLDFPRIPFVETKAEFEALSALGWDLAQKHLLKDVPKLELGAFIGKGDYSVEKPVYSEVQQAVFINKTQFFKPVPRDVWEFHIGGYQVIDKYLKSRKGRTLTLDEIENVTRVCNVLAFTITRMGEIEALYQKAFPDHRL